MTVFVVDDSKSLCRIVSKWVSGIVDGEVIPFTNPLVAFHEAMKNPPDLMIVDMIMPVMDGVELVRSLRKEGVMSEVVFLTGFTDTAIQKLIPGNRVRAVLKKTGSMKELMSEIKRVISERAAHA